MPSVIPATDVYTLGVVCGGALSTGGGAVGGAGAGAAHRPKRVVLLDHEWRQHVITWAVTPEVILQRCAAYKHCTCYSPSLYLFKTHIATLLQELT